MSVVSGQGKKKKIFQNEVCPEASSMMYGTKFAKLICWISLQNKIWNLPDRSTIFPKFIYDKEGKLAGPTQILPVWVRGPALILKTVEYHNTASWLCRCTTDSCDILLRCGMTLDKIETEIWSWAPMCTTTRKMYIIFNYIFLMTGSWWKFLVSIFSIMFWW